MDEDEAREAMTKQFKTARQSLVKANAQMRLLSERLKMMGKNSSLQSVEKMRGELELIIKDMPFIQDYAEGAID